MNFDQNKANQAISKLTNPFLLKLYLFNNLPAAWFVGIGLKSLSLEQAEVRLPYSWWSKNPFQSIYFTALLAAGEFSSGVIAAAILKGFKGKISMLVSHVEADFIKKAKGVCIFTSSDGIAILNCIQTAVRTGEAQTIIAKSIATNKSGEVVAEVRVTWTFKLKVES
ncbi:MAG: DUF4442 domain-containing protein [Saprospiraceae bacterium]